MYGLWTLKIVKIVITLYGLYGLKIFLLITDIGIFLAYFLISTVLVLYKDVSFFVFSQKVRKMDEKRLNIAQSGTV